MKIHYFPTDHERDCWQDQHPNDLCYVATKQSLFGKRIRPENLILHNPADMPKELLHHFEACTIGFRPLTELGMLLNDLCNRLEEKKDFDDELLQRAQEYLKKLNKEGKYASKR